MQLTANHAKYTNGRLRRGVVRGRARVSESGPPGPLEGAGGIGGLLARSHDYSSGNWSTHNAYHADGNGNITYLVNSSQTVAASYRYDPYGNLISSSGLLATANEYRFSSKMVHLGSGLYYYGYRFYEPNFQRWLNRDPIEEEGFVVASRDAQSSLSKVQFGQRVAVQDRLNGLNAYLFLSNDPQNRFDALGLEELKCYTKFDADNVRDQVPEWVQEIIDHLPCFKIFRFKCCFGVLVAGSTPIGVCVTCKCGKR
jgi:RHS repeat-associated protein